MTDGHASAKFGMWQNLQNKWPGFFKRQNCKEKMFPSTGKFANTQLKELHMRLPFAPAIPILGVYPEDIAPTV